MVSSTADTGTQCFFLVNPALKKHWTGPSPLDYMRQYFCLLGFCAYLPQWDIKTVIEGLLIVVSFLNP